MDNPPLASFDQDANDNEELLVLEDLFHSTIIGIHIEEFFGLNKDNITKYETTNANSPKDLDEVDYTMAESNYLQAISANRSREININNTFESNSKTITTFTSRIRLGQGIRLRPLSIFKESVYRCTPSTFTAS